MKRKAPPRRAAAASTASIVVPSGGVATYNVDDEGGDTNAATAAEEAAADEAAAAADADKSGVVMGSRDAALATYDAKSMEGKVDFAALDMLSLKRFAATFQLQLPENPTKLQLVRTIEAHWATLGCDEVVVIERVLAKIRETYY